MKIVFYLVLLAFALLNSTGCSKSANPVEFRRIENPPPSPSPSKDVAIQTPSRTYTLLELYLAEKIDRNYMMRWFFKDVGNYRQKLFYIKDEIETKLPLSEHDENRIVFLEVGMNTAIKKFNERNAVKRSINFVGAVAETRKEKNERNTLYELDEIELRGAPAGAISDNVFGFLSSLIKYGFKIEEVNFLDR